MMKRIVAAALSIAVTGTPCAWAQSSSVFTATGTPIAGSTDTANAAATFTLDGTTLTVQVTNSGTTSSNASLLDGVFFNTDSTAPVSQIRPTVTAAQSWNGSTVTNNVDYTGSWQMKQSVGPTGGNTYSYGLSAVGGSGSFASNQFTKGNGSDDYGLMGSATCSGSNCTTHANKTPLAVGTLTFTIPNFLGTVITSVVFAYNSALSAIVGTTATTTTSTGTVAVPEPASMTVLLGGLAGIAFVRRRKARR